MKSIDLNTTNYANGAGNPFRTPFYLILNSAVGYRLPATRLSGCKTGAPSQADVDRPDPQKVLVSKEACLQFYR